jgi:hypothetical protein
MTRPTFPPIPKPTLTAITEAIPFRVEDMSMPGGDFGLGFSATDRVDDDDDNGDEMNNVGSNYYESSEPQPIDRFQTAEYLDLWADLSAPSNRTRPSIWLHLLIATAIWLFIYL